MFHYRSEFLTSIVGLHYRLNENLHRSNEIGLPFILLSKAHRSPLSLRSWHLQTHEPPNSPSSPYRCLTQAEKEKVMNQLGSIVWQSSSYSIPTLFREHYKKAAISNVAKLIEADDQPPSVIQQSEKAYFSTMGPERHALSRKLALASVLSRGFVAGGDLWQWIENAAACSSCKDTSHWISSIKNHLKRTSNFKVWRSWHRLLVFDPIIVNVVIIVAGSTIRSFAQLWRSCEAKCLVREASGLSSLPGPKTLAVLEYVMCCTFSGKVRVKSHYGSVKSSPPSDLIFRNQAQTAMMLIKGGIRLMYILSWLHKNLYQQHPRKSSASYSTVYTLSL